MATVYPIDAESRHLATIVQLGNKNSATLGFFPEGAFVDFVRKGLILVAEGPSGECMGYLLYRTSGIWVVIVHLCVNTEQRRHGVARQLFEELRSLTSPQYCGVRLRCRRDFAANKVWPKLGFSPVAERPGRGKQRKTLTTWCFEYGWPDLFSSRRENTSLAVLDANILFDLQDPLNTQTEESKALEFDWLTDSVTLCFTDETYNEIDRHEAAAQRAKRRGFLPKFLKLDYDRAELGKTLCVLSKIYPGRTSESDVSDLRQLAKTIAGGAHFFVTRDDPILKRREEVLERCGVEVVRPLELVLSTDKAIHEIQYRPIRLGGTHLRAQRISGSDTHNVVSLFLSREQRERKSDFQILVRKSLAYPMTYECVMVVENDRPVAFYVLDRSDSNILTVPIFRIMNGPLSDVIARHLVWRLIVVSSQEDRPLTLVTDRYLSERAQAALQTAYFLDGSHGWLKAHLRLIGDNRYLSDEIARLRGTFGSYCDYFQQLEKVVSADWGPDIPARTMEIERLAWPVKLVDNATPNFIVPIQPRWAMHLFDEALAREDMFGSDPSLALNVENVYYRASRPGILTSPARVLWYVSDSNHHRGSKQIRACSRINEVAIDRPKDIFQRYRRLGVYDWRELNRICKGELDRPIMGFRFSHTELFASPISWNEMRDIVETTEGRRIQLQSAAKISENSFVELYRRGAGLPDTSFQ